MNKIGRDQILNASSELVNATACNQSKSFLSYFLHFVYHSTYFQPHELLKIFSKIPFLQANLN